MSPRPAGSVVRLRGGIAVPTGSKIAVESGKGVEMTIKIKETGDYECSNLS